MSSSKPTVQDVRRALAGRRFTPRTAAAVEDVARWGLSYRQAARRHGANVARVFEAAGLVPGLRESRASFQRGAHA